MLTAEARVQTDRPGRYLTQLCQHLDNKGRHLGTGKGRLLRHRPGGHQGDHPRPATAEQVQVEWSQTEGKVTFPRGQYTMRAGGSALMLRAEATDGAALEFIENLISSHLGRFSRREPLTVTWHPAEALPAQPLPGGTVEAGGSAGQGAVGDNRNPGPVARPGPGPLDQEPHRLNQRLSPGRARRP